MAALTFSLCLALFGAVFGQDCGRSLFYPEGRIVGGVPASPCSVPWHAHVHFIPNNNDPAFDPSQDLNVVTTLNCGAVILDELHVLISPTCMFLYGSDVQNLLSRVLIAAGDNDVSIFPETSVLGTQQEQFARPDSIYFQDEYNIRNQSQLNAAIDPINNNFRALRDYQCGIMKLTAPLTLNNCVNKICLPTANDDPACTYKGCIHTGNGLTATSASASTPTRKSKTDIIRMTALPADACNVLEQMGKTLPVTNGICAKSETGGVPCINDNGGALACYNSNTQQWFLRGAALVDNCSGDSASSFADVSQCLPFIERTLAGLSTPAV